MKKTQRHKRFGRIMKRSALLLLAAALVIPSKASSAATKVEFDESWEALYVETSNLEGIFDQPYAKFATSVSDVEEYYLNISSEELSEPFSNALTKAKVTHTESTIAPFKASLMQYLYDGDEDEKQVYKAVTAYIPLPGDAQEHSSDCSLYKISGSSAVYVKAPLCVDEYDVYYVQLTFSKQADYSIVYGFVFNSPDDYDEPEAPDDPDEEAPDDESGDIDDEDIDEFDLPEDETPGGDGTDSKNQKPDNDLSNEDDSQLEDDPINEYDLPEDESLADDDEDTTIIPTVVPTKTPAATLAPTKAPEKDSGSNNSSSASQVKDHIPKTGDDFPLTELITVSVLSAVILIAALFKKKH